MKILIELDLDDPAHKAVLDGLIGGVANKPAAPPVAAPPPAAPPVAAPPPAAPPVAAPPPAAPPVAAPPPAAPAAPAGQITAADFASRIAAHAQANKPAATKAALAQMGFAKTADVPPEHYAYVLQQLGV